MEKSAIQEFITESMTYLYQIWNNMTDFIWWKSFFGVILATTVGAENIQIFAALIIVSFIDFCIALIGYLWKCPKCFKSKKVLNWGVKIVVYWMIITAFNYIGNSIEFVDYLTKTIVYVYIFTEALSIIRNDIRFHLTNAKYPEWLIERIESELDVNFLGNLKKKTKKK